MTNEDKKNRNDDVDDDDDKDVDEENDGNVVHSRMRTAKSNTYHYNCQRKSFHFRGEGKYDAGVLLWSRLHYRKYPYYFFLSFHSLLTIL
jgi:hypothetical protein